MAGKQQHSTMYQDAFDNEAFKLCLAGLSDDDIALFFGIDTDTMQKWKTRHPSFANEIRCGRVLADAEVALALYKKATGYERKETVKGEEIQKYYPPDINAIDLWLKNKQPQQWRDKQEPLNITLTERVYTEEEIDAELPDLIRSYEDEQRAKEEHA